MREGININDEFYNSGRWRRFSKHILKRDKYLCRMCLRYGRKNTATIVHHIIPLEIRPDLAFDDANVISVCADCHNKAHPEKAFRASESKNHAEKY